MFKLCDLFINYRLLCGNYSCKLYGGLSLLIIGNPFHTRNFQANQTLNKGFYFDIKYKSFDKNIILKELGVLILEFLALKFKVT